jgi:hypothetical protein
MPIDQSNATVDGSFAASSIASCSANCAIARSSIVTWVEFETTNFVEARIEACIVDFTS